MKTLLALIICVFGFSAAPFAQTRILTVTVKSINATGNVGTNRWSIGPNESAEVLSAVTHVSPSGGSGSFAVEKDGLEFTVWSSRDFSNTPPGIRQVVAGPAVFKITAYEGGTGYLTLAISPTAFPPDKTMVIPAGTGARISLECSTNLLEWTEICSSTHTNSPSNKFFRITAERLP